MLRRTPTTSNGMTSTPNARSSCASAGRSKISLRRWSVRPASAEIFDQVERQRQKAAGLQHTQQLRDGLTLVVDVLDNADAGDHVEQLVIGGDVEDRAEPRVTDFPERPDETVLDVGITLQVPAIVDVEDLGLGSHAAQRERECTASSADVGDAQPSLEMQALVTDRVQDERIFPILRGVDIDARRLLLHMGGQPIVRQVARRIDHVP